MAINAVMVLLGPESGLAIGGMLVSNFDWQSIFSVNIPIGITVIGLVHFVVPSTTGKPQKFDCAGAFTSFLS